MTQQVRIKNRLRELRQSAGFGTQTDLAERLGVRQTAISAIETGENFVSEEMLAGLCETLNCDVGDIFFANRESYHF
ncbi:MAG: helix-turn-helix transcriptional regulator [Janthinobacterium lividum]